MQGLIPSSYENENAPGLLASYNIDFKATGFRKLIPCCEIIRLQSVCPLSYHTGHR